MPELTYAISKAVNNNTGNAETRKPNDAFPELDTLLPARAGDEVTKTATTPKIEHEEGYTRSSTRESNDKKKQHLSRHTC